jgi:hypothetical protein
MLVAVALVSLMCVPAAAQSLNGAEMTKKTKAAVEPSFPESSGDSTEITFSGIQYNKKPPGCLFDLDQATKIWLSSPLERGQTLRALFVEFN